MISVAEAAAWKLKLQLCRPAGISNGFSLGRVWSGVWSGRYVLASVDPRSLFAYLETFQAGTAAPATVEADCVFWWALVTGGAAGGWQPWRLTLTGLAVPGTRGVQAVPQLLGRATFFPHWTCCPTHPDPSLSSRFPGLQESGAGSWVMAPLLPVVICHPGRWAILLCL